MKRAPLVVALGHARSLARSLNTSRLARSFAILLSGTAIAQVVALAASPLLTRIFEPEAFGVLGVFMALAALLGTVAPLAYSLAIVVPSDEREAADLTVLAGVATAVTVTLVALVTAFGRESIAKVLNAPDLSPVLLWLPLAVLADGCYRTMTFVALRAGREGRVARSRIVHSTSAAGLQVLFGVGGLLRHGLTLGYALGHALAAASLALQTGRGHGLPALRSTTLASLRATARRYGDFPRFKLPSQILGVASSMVTLVALAALFTPAVVGFYALTRRVVRGPAELVGTTLGDAFFARFGAVWPHDRPRAARTWRRATLLLASVVVPAVGVFAAIGPSLFSWLFGEAWSEAGRYARWLSPFIGASVIARLASMCLSVIGRQRAELAFTSARILSMTGALVIAAPAGPEVAIAVYAAVGTVLMAGLIVFTAVVLQRAQRERPLSAAR